MINTKFKDYLLTLSQTCDLCFQSLRPNLDLFLSLEIEFENSFTSEPFPPDSIENYYTITTTETWSFNRQDNWRFYRLKVLSKNGLKMIVLFTKHAQGSLCWHQNFAQHHEIWVMTCHKIRCVQYSANVCKIFHKIGRCHTSYCGDLYAGKWGVNHPSEGSIWRLQVQFHLIKGSFAQNWIENFFSELLAIARSLNW